MSYLKLFDPHAVVQRINTAELAERLGDRGAESTDDVYEFDDDIIRAVNVALAAGRPLLVRGAPGTGKSSLARNVARLLGWRFYATTVSSRTTARDLLWTFDAAARLADAQVGPKELRPRSAYVEPGPLWWAFDRESAVRRGATSDDARVTPATDPYRGSPSERAVVLIDEIDKADPDVPNDLLLPLGSYQFVFEDGNLVLATAAPLVVITTNEERDLPRAFVRRCVVLGLAEPDEPRLKRIARMHFPHVPDDRLDQLAAAYFDIRAQKTAEELRPSLAEFLDAVAACLPLATGPDTPDWPQLARLLLDKAPADDEPL